MMALNWPPHPSVVLLLANELGPVGRNLKMCPVTINAHVSVLEAIIMMIATSTRRLQSYHHTKH